jgi:hypothetical protein
MSDSSTRWRRLALAALLVGIAVVVLRRRVARTRDHEGEPTADETGTGTDEGVSVRLDGVSIGNDLTVPTGELDPTLAAEVLELNVQALETVEEAWVRDTVDAALAEDADLDEVERRLGEQVRENDVTDTAIEELDALGFRGMLNFGGSRRDRDDETDEEE